MGHTSPKVCALKLVLFALPNHYAEILTPGTDRSQSWVCGVLVRNPMSRPEPSTVTVWRRRGRYELEKLAEVIPHWCRKRGLTAAADLLDQDWERMAPWNWVPGWGKGPRWRGPLPQRGVRSDPVVLLPSLLDHDPCLLQRAEDLPIQAFLPQLPIEALAVPFSHGLPVPQLPGNKLRPFPERIYFATASPPTASRSH